MSSPMRENMLSAPLNHRHTVDELEQDANLVEWIFCRYINLISDRIKLPVCWSDQQIIWHIFNACFQAAYFHAEDRAEVRRHHPASDRDRRNNFHFV